MIIVLLFNQFCAGGEIIGKNYGKFDRERITYVFNNKEKSIIGKLVGQKDGKIYISSYPERKLVVINSAQFKSEDFIYPDNYGWINVDSDYYYKSQKGLEYSKWIMYSGKWYYLKHTGEMAKSEWVEYEDNYYYVNKDGSMAVDTYINGFYVDKDGKYIEQ